MSERMTQREYEQAARYYIFHLIVLPLIIIFGIKIVGDVIETSFNFQLGVAKDIFMAVGGIGYFVWYFREWLKKIIEHIQP